MATNPPESFDDGLQFVEDTEKKSEFVPGCFAGGGVAVLLLFTLFALALQWGSEFPFAGLLLGSVTAVAAGSILQYNKRKNPHKYMRGAVAGGLIVIGVVALALGLCVAMLSNSKF